MKASPTTIITHPNLSDSQKAVGLLSRFAESVTNGYDTRYDRKRKGSCERRWQLESEINQLQSTLPSLTEISGHALLKALSFHGYRIFMRDPSGYVFRVHSHEEYYLSDGRVRVRSPLQSTREYDHTEDVRCAYGLMYHKVHPTVKGKKILLLNVNATFSSIYPTVVEL